MLYQFPTCGGLKFKILCAIWECQSFTKEKKGLGKIPHLSLVAKPLVTHGEFYFSPLVASPLRGEKSNPFSSSVKDWVISPRVTSAHDDFTEKNRFCTYINSNRNRFSEWPLMSGIEISSSRGLKKTLKLARGMKSLPPAGLRPLGG